MRVYVPFVPGMLRPEVTAALDGLGVAYEPIAIKATDDSAYPRLVCRWWARGETFAIIEQDNVPRADVFAAWEDCGHLACGFPYWIGPNQPVAPWLGCTQFSAGLLRSHPRLAYDANNGSTPGLPTWHWRSQDVRIKQELARCGLEIVAHEPPIAHLHYELAPGVTLQAKRMQIP